jgi:ubiquinone/menaquinone biosynthesis C-methylase UbiE|tara:strand:- start:582 stop:1289 length:708 start_codon:yes stop_codon:yes gene_type:complete
MRQFTSLSRRLAAVWLSASLAGYVAAPVAAQDASVNPGINRSYESPDLGRLQASLEGERRAIYQYRHAIVAALGLQEGMAVADIGSGTGFIARLIAHQVGSNGRVYAMDIAQDLLDHVVSTADADGLSNVVPVLGDQHTTNLQPDSVELALVCDVYHHFEFPSDSLASIHQALRDDGLLVVVDFERVVGVSADFQLTHVRAGKGTVTDEIKNTGFDFVKEIPLIPDQYYLVFRKR